jgi:hypothetical protein
MVSKAMDTSETKILKLQQAHRDEMEGMREKHKLEIGDMREKHAHQIGELQEEVARLRSSDVTLRALRMICPPRTFSTIDTLMA